MKRSRSVARVSVGLVMMIGATLGKSEAQAQEGATPPAPEQTFTFSLESATRSFRIDPPGVSVRIPDEMSIDTFGKSGPTNLHLLVKGLDPSSGYDELVELDIFMQSMDCNAWLARMAQSKGKMSKLDTRKPLYDARWNPTYAGGKGEPQLNLCLDYPKGSVQLIWRRATGYETSPARLAFSKLTANIANAFLPATANMAAATEKKVTSVDDVYPQEIASMAADCKQYANSDDRQLQYLSAASCNALQAWKSEQSLCVSGDDRTCVSIGDQSAKEKDYATAAVYYQRACDLGNKRACSKAEDTRKKH